MFGLIKHPRSSKDNYAAFRKNYCGTCKTIGKLYGQKERLLLNNDIVFLSELLAEIKNEPIDFEHIKINSCFNLPSDVDHIPNFLKYTASINILLGYYKVADNIEDAKYKWNIWRFVKKLQNTSFKKAKKILSDARFSTDKIESLIIEQFKIEAGKKSFDDLKEQLEYYSGPTRQITGEVFKHGAFIVNKRELSSTLYSIGAAYGQIVYLCDAIKDYKKDLRNNYFNPFRLDNKSGKREIDPVIKLETYQYLSACVCQIQNLMALLPVSFNKTIFFVKRIWESIDTIFYSQKSCSSMIHKKEKGYLKGRIDRALNRAQLISQTINLAWLKRLTYPLIAGILIILFISFPDIIHASQPKHEDSACCENCCDCATDGCSC